MGGVFFFVFFVFFSQCVRSNVGEEDGLCELFELENTECWSILSGKEVNVPLNMTQQEMFDQISLPISDVRMKSRSCRSPLIRFYCNSIFSLCSTGISSQLCADCLVAQDECVQILNCSDLICSQKQTNRQEEGEKEEQNEREQEKELEPVPVWTCRNETAMNITCCAFPFFHSEMTEECLYPQCPYYAFGKREQETAVYVYFGLSYLSLVIYLFGMFPFFFLRSNFQMPGNLSLLLIGSHLCFLFSTNWGGYVGSYNFSCPIVGEKEDRDQFLESEFCMAQAFLFSFWLLCTCCWFFWYSFRIFIQSFQHSLIWIRFNLPTDIGPSPFSFILIYSSVLVISVILSLSYFVFMWQDPPPAILLAFNFACFPAPASFGFFLVYLPLLIIITFSTLLVLASVFWLLWLRFEFPWRFILVLSLFFAILDGIIFFILGFQSKVTSDRGLLSSYAACVASFPRQSDYVDVFCVYSPLSGFIESMVFFSLLASFPIIYVSIVIFTQSWFWIWWYDFLTKRKIRKVSMAELSSGRISHDEFYQSEISLMNIYHQVPPSF